MLSGLTVEFAGEEHHVTRSLTFGRAGDLCIDENEYMHRWVGEFFHDGRLWWLRNRGSRIPLTLIAHDGKWVQLPPQANQALSEGVGVVRFQAGRTNYELSYRGVPAEPDAGGVTHTGSGDGADQTLRFEIDLTPREVDYLACFCSSLMTQSPTSSMPTYAEVAQVWGVSVKTLDNALQQLRRKIREAGFVGADSSDSLANFALTHGLIRQADLDWAALDQPEGSRPAAKGPRFKATPR